MKVYVVLNQYHAKVASVFTDEKNAEIEACHLNMSNFSSDYVVKEAELED